MSEGNAYASETASRSDLHILFFRTRNHGDFVNVPKSDRILNSPGDMCAFASV